MGRIFNFILSCFLFLLFAAPIFKSRAASVTHSEACEALLFAIRGFHSFPEASRALTAEALDNTIRFHRNVLQRPDADPNHKMIAGDSASPNQIHHQIASRVAGLEDDYQRDDKGNSGARLVVHGTVIVGADKVAAFADETQGHIRRIQQTHEALGRTGGVLNRTREEVHLTLSAASTFLVPSLLYVASNSSLIYAFAVPFLYGYLILGPEVLMRHLLQIDRVYSRFQDQLRAFVTQPPSEAAWRFDSINYRLPSSLVNNLWKFGNIDQDLLSQTVDNNETFFARIMRNYVFNEPARINDVYIYIDRLLDYEPETLKPRMTLITRFMLDPPQGRRRTRPLDETDTTLVPNGVLVPLPIRVR